jgi:chromosome segregation ATPase
MDTSSSSAVSNSYQIEVLQEQVASYQSLIKDLSKMVKELKKKVADTEAELNDVKSKNERYSVCVSTVANNLMEYFVQNAEHIQKCKNNNNNPEADDNSK